MLFRLSFSCPGDGLSRMVSLVEANSIERAAQKLGLKLKPGYNNYAVIQRCPDRDPADVIGITFNMITPLRDPEQLRSVLGIRPVSKCG